MDKVRELQLQLLEKFFPEGITVRSYDRALDTLLLVSRIGELGEETKVSSVPETEEPRLPDVAQKTLRSLKETRLGQMSITTIAKEAKLKPADVRRALSLLRRAGYPITTVQLPRARGQRGASPALYRLT